MDQDDSMSDASSDGASSMSGDGGNCDSCGSWGLTPDFPGSGFNICQICQGNFCNHCSIMCPGGCDNEFCHDCAQNSLVHYLPDDGRMLHTKEVYADASSPHNAEGAVEDMFYGHLNPFCSAECVHTFRMEHAEDIYAAKVDLAATNASLAAHLKLKKWAMFFKFILRIGFFNETKRMAASETVYKPGGKGYRRTRDEFEDMASAQVAHTQEDQFNAVHALVVDMLGKLNQ